MLMRSIVVYMLAPADVPHATIYADNKLESAVPVQESECITVSVWTKMMSGKGRILQMYRREKPYQYSDRK